MSLPRDKTNLLKISNGGCNVKGYHLPTNERIFYIY